MKTYQPVIVTYDRGDEQLERSHFITPVGDFTDDIDAAFSLGEKAADKAHEDLKRSPNYLVKAAVITVDDYPKGGALITIELSKTVSGTQYLTFQRTRL